MDCRHGSEDLHGGAAGRELQLDPGLGDVPGAVAAGGSRCSVPARRRLGVPDTEASRSGDIRAGPGIWRRRLGLPGVQFQALHLAGVQEVAVSVMAQQLGEDPVLADDLAESVMQPAMWAKVRTRIGQG